MQLCLRANQHALLYSVLQSHKITKASAMTLQLI